MLQFAETANEAKPLPWASEGEAMDFEICSKKSYFPRF